MLRYEEEQIALAATWSHANRRSIAAMCRDRHIALASHDDATAEHVLESHQLGSVIAEFPTTLAAAEASRRHGMNVLMGAPISCAAVHTPATSRPISWRPATCSIFCRQTIIPPACSMRRSASRTTTTTPSRCRRPFVWSAKSGPGSGIRRPRGDRGR